MTSGSAPSDSAARYSPAGHPSVLVTSACTEAKSSSSPAWRSRIDASAGIIARSWTRNFDQRPASPKATEGQWRLGPRADRDHRAGGDLLEQPLQPAAQGLGLGPVRVVEDEHDATTRIGAGEECADVRFEVVVLERVRVPATRTRVHRARTTRTTGSTCRIPAGRRSPPATRSRALASRRTSVVRLTSPLRVVRAAADFGDGRRGGAGAAAVGVIASGAGSATRAAAPGN